jgi:hypothetical protein
MFCMIPTVKNNSLRRINRLASVTEKQYDSCERGADTLYVIWIKVVS